MIPILGYLGSALATLSCYASMTIICYLLGRKHYPIPYEVGSALFYLSLTGIIAWLSLQISISNQVFYVCIPPFLIIEGDLNLKGFGQLNSCLYDHLIAYTYFP